MGNANVGPPTARGAVSEGKTRICVAGYSISPNYTRAHNVAHMLTQEFPAQYEHWHYGPDRDGVCFLFLLEFLIFSKKKATIEKIDLFHFSSG